MSHTDRTDWERAQAVLPRLSLKAGYSLGGMESHRQRQLGGLQDVYPSPVLECEGSMIGEDQTRLLRWMWARPEDGRRCGGSVMKIHLAGPGARCGHLGTPLKWLLSAELAEWFLSQQWAFSQSRRLVFLHSLLLHIELKLAKVHLNLRVLCKAICENLHASYWMFFNEVFYVCFTICHSLIQDQLTWMSTQLLYIQLPF